MTTSPVLSITDELLAELDALLGLNANGSLSKPLPYLSRVLLEKSVAHIRSLTERLKVAEKDAVRYAHLKAAWDEDKLISYLDSCVLPSDWDAVIDAAIAQEGQSHE